MLRRKQRPTFCGADFHDLSINDTQKRRFTFCHSDSGFGRDTRLPVRGSLRFGTRPQTITPW
jgi:hypothetical protein